MAAQVIAADLELDLFRVDLASVVSKYIGETAKHLSADLRPRRAHERGVVLRRGGRAIQQAHRNKGFARPLRQRRYELPLAVAQDYSGIVILASNKKQNIDAAFIRRVRYVFEFAPPDTSKRGRIWQKVIEGLSGQETLNRLEATIASLAANIEMSGAQIKNAALAAIFVACRNGAPLAMAHLLRGVERELSKEGRALGVRERERLMRDG